MLFFNRRKQTLEKWLILRIEQEVYKVILGYLIVETKEAYTLWYTEVHIHTHALYGHTRPVWLVAVCHRHTVAKWPKLEQFEQPNN